MALVFALPVPAGVRAQPDAPIAYTLSFPEPEHRWMQVDVVFPDLPAGPLELQFSRSSPGRYALHEFAKNVYDVELTDAAGKPVVVERPSLHRWTVSGHSGAVRMRYRVYGDRVDGTYLGIDATHAHINMPAALVWARGLERRASEITFERPAGREWEVATQLMPTDDPLVFRASNLQYLMDSPTEFGTIDWHSFPAPDAADPAATIRIALHHAGSSAEARAYAADVRRIVAEAREVFGEYPAFENRTYTFLVDYLPSASGDGMEHRNSTVLTSRGSIASSRIGLLGTVAHEFFHAWNVERIRPRSLEPFDFTNANVSPDLWLAEGVTSYYDGLLLLRAGLTSLDQFVADLDGVVGTVILSPAHRFRSAEDMSRLAPFVDAASWVDRTNWTNTFISYYTFGAALGLGFDLAIRQHTAGRATLDDFMRAMWQRHGRPGGSPAGSVAHPYTVDDVIAVLAEVTGDPAFARDLVERHVQGRELMDYQRLLAQAGLILRSRNPDRASLGLVAFESGAGGLKVAAPTRLGSAAYRAGIDQDDEIKAVNGEPVRSVQQLESVLARLEPGDRVTITFTHRGRNITGDTLLEPDPRPEIVTVEAAGGQPTPEQVAFRKAWTE